MVGHMWKQCIIFMKKAVFAPELGADADLQT